MAKIDTQSIPSEDRINYKRACQISTTIRGVTYIRRRFPWRLPKMQKGGYGVAAGQLVQRGRFGTVKNVYVPLSAEVKARWAAANPEYESFLFGYNFFMMEGLLGGGPPGFEGMIKSIQVVKEEVPKTGAKVFVINAIDPTKAVVLIQGSARKVPRVLRGSGSVATGGSTLAIGDTIDPDKCTVELQGASAYVYEEEFYALTYPIFPYVFSLTTTQIQIKWALTPNFAANIGWEIKEHVEGVVHPVLVSIAAEAITIDWAEVPDTAAVVSITVVEYL